MLLRAEWRAKKRGRVEGIEPEVLALCDGALEIPMFGNKESFNVVQAAAMALYHCRFMIG
jgi:tRNA G18 (ribose-2'-O)-methylase SpoU